METKTLQAPVMQLMSISLTRSEWGDTKGCMTGTARYRMKTPGGRSGYDDDTSSTELKIVLTPDQIALITQACGDTIKATAQRQAQIFYENAAEMVGNLLENKSTNDEA